MKYTAYEKTKDSVYPEKLTVKTFWGNTYIFLRTRYEWYNYSDNGIDMIGYGSRFYYWTSELNNLIDKARFDDRNNILP